MTEARLLSILREHLAQKKTGVMEITSPRASANLRLVRGEIVFAEAGHSTGEKALFRALALRDARSAFYERDVSNDRNIDAKTDELMAAGAIVVEEILELHTLFAGDAPLVAIDPGPPTVNLSKPRVIEELSPAARRLLHFLRSPIKLDDLLDADHGSDHEILIGLAQLEKAGRLKTLASSKSKIAVAQGDDLAKIERAIESRTTSMRASRPRLVLAGAPHRLALVAHAISCFEGASPPAETLPGTPAVPMPYVVARWMSERIDIDLVVCPLVPAYSPLWPMAVAGAHAALRMDSAARDLFDRACAAAAVKIVDASALLPTHDDTKVEDVATLIRYALLA
jgi:Domain of unknown function (DUF4388)